MKILFQISLYIFLIFTLFVLATSKREILNIRSYVVLTGSMEPAIPVGSILFTHKRSRYNIGDIITFKNGPVDITHRVISTKAVDNVIFYQTKGDGNQTADKQFVANNNISGKMIFTIPYIGKSALFYRELSFYYMKSMPLILLRPAERDFGGFQLPDEAYEKIPLAQVRGASIANWQRKWGMVILVSVPYLFTQSFFNDTSLSSANTFSAVSVEPTVTPTPTVEISTNHIVISEVQIGGTTANQDFVELYNPTVSPVNIGGWRIRKKTSLGTISSLASIPAGKIIPAQGFFLWSNSQASYNLSIGSDISNTNTLADNNSIELQDNDGPTIDQVGWGTGINQFVEGEIITTGPTSSQSLERKAVLSSTQESMSTGEDELKGNGFDTNNNSIDFLLRVQSQPQNTQSSTESL